MVAKGQPIGVVGLRRFHSSPLSQESIGKTEDLQIDVPPACAAENLQRRVGPGAFWRVSLQEQGVVGVLLTWDLQAHNVVIPRESQRFTKLQRGHPQGVLLRGDGRMVHLLWLLGLDQVVAGCEGELAL